jgi:hypothetical protein
MNWRRGLKRVAALYLICAAIIIVGSFVVDLSKVNCPTEYRYTADQMFRAEVIKQREAKREAIRGRCDVLTPAQVRQREQTRRSEEILGIPPGQFYATPGTVAPPLLPACPPDAMKLDPIPRQVDTTIVVPGEEVRACWLESYNWWRTIWSVIWVVSIPLALALLAASGLGLFRLGRWLYQGFKGSDSDV